MGAGVRRVAGLHVTRVMCDRGPHTPENETMRFKGYHPPRFCRLG